MVKWGVKAIVSVAVAFLLGVSVISVILYVVTFRENQALVRSYSEVKNKADSLEQENQNLLQSIEKEKELQQRLSAENTGLQENLQSAQERLNQIASELASAQEHIDGLNAKMTALSTENVALKEENEKSHLLLAQVEVEREDYKTKLSSVAELKKAIKELKRQARKVGVAIVRKVQEKKKALAKEYIQGNQGFLVRDGKVTSQAVGKIKIEITPLPPSE